MLRSPGCASVACNLGKRAFAIFVRMFSGAVRSITVDSNRWLESLEAVRRNVNRPTGIWKLGV